MTITLKAFFRTFEKKKTPLEGMVRFSDEPTRIQFTRAQCYEARQTSKEQTKMSRFMLGDVAARLRSHMIGLIPFESTIEQTTETMPLSLKQ